MFFSHIPSLLPGKDLYRSSRLNTAGTPHGDGRDKRLHSCGKPLLFQSRVSARCVGGENTLASCRLLNFDSTRRVLFWLVVREPCWGSPGPGFLTSKWASLPASRRLLTFAAHFPRKPAVDTVTPSDRLQVGDPGSLCKLTHEEEEEQDDDLGRGLPVLLCMLL